MKSEGKTCSAEQAWAKAGKSNIKVQEEAG